MMGMPIIYRNYQNYCSDSLVESNEEGKCFYYSAAETNLSPTTDIIRIEIKKTFQNPADSWKKNIPINTVPIAPIPVQTA